MKVDPASAAESFQYQGATYYFCCDGCLALFRADPAKYLAKSAPAAVHVPPKRAEDPQGGMVTYTLLSGHAPPKRAQYTCPMHPEVVQSGPGSCPKCGMALVPMVPAAPAAAEFTCPMHPEIRSPIPGNCPKCGMALVPVAGAQEDDSELRDMTRRFWVSLALSVPIVALAMVLPQLGGHVYTPAAQRWGALAQLALATPVVRWGGWPFFHKFWR